MIVYTRRYDNLVVQMNTIEQKWKESDFLIRRNKMNFMQESNTNYYLPYDKYGVDRKTFKKYFYFDRQLKQLIGDDK